MNKSGYRLFCTAVFLMLMFFTSLTFISLFSLDEISSNLILGDSSYGSRTKMLQNGDEPPEFTLGDIFNASALYILIGDITNNLVDSVGPQLALIVLSIFYILILIAQVIIAPIPGVVFFVAAGFLYPYILAEYLGFPAEIGVVIGTIIGTTGSCLGAIFAWGVSYAGGYPIAKRFLGEKNMGDATKWLNRWGALGIFLARMMPFAPSDPVSYIAGAGRMKFKVFIIPVIIGSLIATLLYTIMGYMLYRAGKDLTSGSSVDTGAVDTIMLLIFLGCLAIVVVVVVYQKWKFKQMELVSVPDDGFLTPEERTLEELQENEMDVQLEEIQEIKESDDDSFSPDDT